MTKKTISHIYLDKTPPIFHVKKMAITNMTVYMVLLDKKEAIFYIYHLFYDQNLFITKVLDNSIRSNSSNKRFLSKTRT